MAQCKYCHKEYIRTSNRQQFCCPSHRVKYYKEENAAMHARFCKLCGDILPRHQTKQGYCKVCAEILKQHSGQSIGACKDKLRYKAATHDLKNSIADINKKAREAGMSYGKYKALIGG